MPRYVIVGNLNPKKHYIIPHANSITYDLHQNDESTDAVSNLSPGCQIFGTDPCIQTGSGAVADDAQLDLFSDDDVMFI